MDKDEKRDILRQLRDSFKNIRDKTIFICLTSSGLDGIDFKLKIRNFRLGYRPSYNVSYQNGGREKGSKQYQTFFNTEASDLIHLYLKERARLGEWGIKYQESKNKENPNRNPTELFKKDYDNGNFDYDWLFVQTKRKKDGTYQQINSNNFAESLAEARKIINLNNVTPKSLRKWFNSVLKSNGVLHEIVERMMGHQVKVPQFYIPTLESEELFTKDYVENMMEYTLLGYDKSLMNKEIDTLKKATSIFSKDNEDFRTQIKERDGAIDTLTDKLNTLTETVVQLQSMIMKGDIALSPRLPEVIGGDPEKEHIKFQDRVKSQ
jgi:site-specific recombinase XerD